MWENKGFTYPIAVDFDISNKCNNNCPLCNGSKNLDQSRVSFEDAKKIITQLKEVNIRAISFGGGGEPTCNPDIGKILNFIYENRISESAIYTNAYELSDKVIESIVNCCTWMRISLDADGPELYKKTHGVDEKAFSKVIENISKLIMEREKNSSEILIGTCYLLGSHTIRGVYEAARLSKELGVDYIRFRPFLNRDGRRNFPPEKGNKMIEELEKCRELQDSNFFISYPKERCEYEAMKEERKRNYKVCYFPHFFASITADLKLYPCCALKGNKKYLLGDLKKNTFKEIWLSEKRLKVHESIDLIDCPNPCQFENHIEFLYSIKQPIEHSNFL